MKINASKIIGYVMSVMAVVAGIAVIFNPAQIVVCLACIILSAAFFNEAEESKSEEQ